MIVYVLGKFPNLSETFILNELVELGRRGIEIQIVAFEKGTMLTKSDDCLRTNKVIYYRSFFLLQKLFAHLYFMLTLKKYFTVLVEILIGSGVNLRLFFSSLKAFSISIYFLFRLRHFPIKLIHAHFINFPASVAQIMSKLSDVPFSCTAHANDIYTGSAFDIIQKIKTSKFIITCTKANKEYLDSLSSNKYTKKVFHIYHGINATNWAPKVEDFNMIRAKEIRVLSVARLVEKKGIVFLLEAIKILINKGNYIKCSIVGDGPLRGELEKFVRNNRLEEIVTFHGAVPHFTIGDFYDTADVFILPCNITAEGDRDGLPNVLLEAMAQGIPVISTDVSAVPELIENRITGLLVDQNNSIQIADALLELIKNSELRQTIGENGRILINKEFGIEKSTNQLADLFLN